jgi:hypothetical protein
MKLKVTDIKPNPTNPRVIKDDNFKKLVQSIKNFPEMADVREIVVNEDHVILGGNMRFKAMVTAGWKEVPVRVVDWPEEKQREFMIKDNVSGGDWDWDELANSWDKDQLEAWGLDVDKWDNDEEGLSDDYSQKLGEVVYEPKETNHKISDLIEIEHKFDSDINAIKNEELKELCRARLSYFHTFNYSKIADYYAYQATPEEKKVFEKLALVLLDKDQLIEHGFSKIIDSLTDEADIHD